MIKAYSSNLTQAQWELLESLIPPAKPGGRPRKVEIWAVLNAIFYVLTQGCTWRNLPADFPSWQTVYTYFRNWRKDKTWLKIHDHLREWVRLGLNLVKTGNRQLKILRFKQINSKHGCPFLPG